jgi:hypothetical protein
MERSWPIVAAAVLALATVDVASATTKHRRYHRPAVPVRPAASPYQAPYTTGFRPFVSPYDCLIDEGYGRYRLCSASTNTR